MKTYYYFYNKPTTARVIRAVLKTEGKSLRKLKRYLAQVVGYRKGTFELGDDCGWTISIEM